jgi:hypothetical protein
MSNSLHFSREFKAIKFWVGVAVLPVEGLQKMIKTCLYNVYVYLHQPTNGRLPRRSTVPSQLGQKRMCGKQVSHGIFCFYAMHTGCLYTVRFVLAKIRRIHRFCMWKSTNRWMTPMFKWLPIIAFSPQELKRLSLWSPLTKHSLIAQNITRHRSLSIRSLRVSGPTQRNVSTHNMACVFPSRTKQCHFWLQ